MFRTFNPIARSLAIAIALLFQFNPAFAAKKLALVLGNSNYQHTSKLKNPANDAKLITAKLEEIGFEVVGKQDLSNKETQALVAEFAQKISEVGEDGIVLFYYAGHGIQYNGENFIVPVDANLTSDTDIILQGINTSIVLKIIELAGAKTNVVVLDACRNNPFVGVSRSVSNGLARMDSPSGSLIAYSTAPGAVALDGDGENSPYTAALAEYITDPTLTLEGVFKKVRRKVYYDTDKAQTTWESTSLIEEVYLVDRQGEDSAASTDVQKPAALVEEELFWNQIRDKKDPQLFQTYLQMFPQGKFREIALAQLPRASDEAKRVKPKAQKFEYSNEELEQRFAKFNKILALLTDDNIQRGISSYDRYRSWCCKNLKKGPTGKERYISYGLYGLFPLNWEQYVAFAKFDEQTVKLMETHGNKPETWMEKFEGLPLAQPTFDTLDNPTAALINAFIEMHPEVQKADRYYTNELYNFDKAKGARDLHAKLYPKFEKFISAYVALARIALDEMEKIKSQELDYIALKNGKSWEWYGARENYFLLRFALEFHSDPKLNKKKLTKAYKEYVANFLEITDFASNAPAPPTKLSDLINLAGERGREMKDIIESKRQRYWSQHMDVSGWFD